MKTANLITYIQRKCPDWDRQTLLDILNDVQNMVFMRPIGAMRIVDESTGVDPVLTTVSGQYTYELTEQLFGYDVQVVGHVVTPNSGYLQYQGEYGSDLIKTSVVAHKATANRASYLVFSEDPGDSTYSIQCYRKPKQLTSEKIQLEIPDAYHIDNIAKGVIGKCEEAEHGISNIWDSFKNDLLPELRNDMDSEGTNNIHLIDGKGY